MDGVGQLSFKNAVFNAELDRGNGSRGWAKGQHHKGPGFASH